MSGESAVPLPRPGDDVPGAPPPLRGREESPVETPRVKPPEAARGDSGAMEASADRRAPVLVAGVALAVAAGFLAARRLRRARTP